MALINEIFLRELISENGVSSGADMSRLLQRVQERKMIARRGPEPAGDRERARERQRQHSTEDARGV